MTLTNRIQNLMQALCQEFPERQDRLQLGFLAAINNESFYLYGRAGSGKNFLIERLLSAFKKTNVLKVDSRPQGFPANLDNYDVIWFNEFNPIDDDTKSSVRNALRNRKNSTLILSSDVRPENAMGRADIADEITLTIYMPDNLSSDALCMLLQNHGLNDNFKVPDEYTISDEEKEQWANEIQRVTLSPDTMAIIGKLSELCIQNAIYVPISKWLSLANIARTIAFFNGRNETTFSDALFLGTSIWGRSTSNNVIMDNFNNIVKSVILKDLANVVESSYDADSLYRRVPTICTKPRNSTENPASTIALQSQVNRPRCMCHSTMLKPTKISTRTMNFAKSKRMCAATSTELRAVPFLSILQSRASVFATTIPETKTPCPPGSKTSRHSRPTFSAKTIPKSQRKNASTSKHARKKPSLKWSSRQRFCVRCVTFTSRTRLSETACS